MVILQAFFGTDFQLILNSIGKGWVRPCLRANYDTLIEILISTL